MTEEEKYYARLNREAKQADRDRAKREKEARREADRRASEERQHNSDMGAAYRD